LDGCSVASDDDGCARFLPAGCVPQNLRSPPNHCFLVTTAAQLGGCKSGISTKQNISPWLGSGCGWAHNAGGGQVAEGSECWLEGPERLGRSRQIYVPSANTTQLRVTAQRQLTSCCAGTAALQRAYGTSGQIHHKQRAQFITNKGHSVAAVGLTAPNSVKPKLSGRHSPRRAGHAGLPSVADAPMSEGEVTSKVLHRFVRPEVHTSRPSA
jgi:hypothetical protein